MAAETYAERPPAGTRLPQWSAILLDESERSAGNAVRACRRAGLERSAIDREQAPQRKWRRRPQAPASRRLRLPRQRQQARRQVPPRSYPWRRSGPAPYTPTEGSSRAGALVIEGEGALTAAEVMEFDGAGQLVWADEGTRAWVGSKAAGETVNPRTRALLDMARRQYEMGKYKAAVRTLWDLHYTNLPGDQLLEAARGILDLANEIGARVDGSLGAECADLVARSRKALDLALAPSAPTPAPLPLTVTGTRPASAAPRARTYRCPGASCRRPS